MEVKQIVSRLLESNTYVVSNNNKSIIIDAGAEIENVLPQTIGTKVEAVLLTHLHFDHCYNLLSYVNQFNCPVYVFNTEFVGLNPFTLASMFGKLTLPKNCYKSLQGVTKLNLAGLIVECFHTPGHSLDSMSFKINDCLFSGDTLFYNSIGRTDLETSNRLNMLQSLELLKGVTFNVCYSGHGKSSTYAEQQENIKYFLLEL